MATDEGTTEPSDDRTVCAICNTEFFGGGWKSEGAFFCSGRCQISFKRKKATARAKAIAPQIAGGEDSSSRKRKERDLVEKMNPQKKGRVDDEGGEDDDDAAWDGEDEGDDEDAKWWN